MILAQLVVFLAALAGLTLVMPYAMNSVSPKRWLVGVCAVGIAAISQQVLIMLVAGALHVLLGIIRQKARHPAQRALGKMNVVAGLILIGVAVYLYYVQT